MFKKSFLKIFFVLFLGLFVCIPIFTTSVSDTQAATQKSWYFEKFDVTIEVDQDSSFVVKEEQTFNFTGNFHYVTRSILKRRLDKITDIKVTESDGSKLKGATFAVDEDSDYVYVQVDFDLTDTSKTWLFEYKVHGGIGYFDTYDELYWNAVSSEREVKIKESTVKVTLPTKVPKDEMKQDLFTEAKESSFKILNQKTFIWEASDLPAYSNLTIVSGWPKDYVFEPFTKSKEFRLIVGLISVAIGIIVFVLMLVLWLTKGRDRGLRKTIVAQYEPPDKLLPAEMGVLIKEKFESKFITATLINLAVNGHLKIIEKEKKGLFGKNKSYTLEKLKASQNLSGYEKKIFEGIFGSKKKVKLDDLQNKFYREIEEIKKELHNSIEKRSYFVEAPWKVRAAYYLIAFFTVAIGIGLIFMDFLGHGWLSLSFVTSGMIIFLFGRKMPARTDVGSKAYEHVLGFKEYLHTAERFRLKAMTPETFEKFLPYAIILGVEKQWANRFEDIYQDRSPDWYVSSSRGFSAYALTTSLGSFNNNFSATAASRPGGSASSGSGFSGGFSGGGGGGGGSGAG
ncbi:DUF2207 domain-containing protein [Patescibacteria group bacterium]